MRLKPIKVKGFISTYKKEALKIEHKSFRELFLNVLRGKVKLKKKENKT